MKLRLLSLIAILTALPIAARAAEPVSVMIVGGFHMSGSHDLHNAQVDDMLVPKRQAEISAITDALARFKPTAVAAEWDAGVAAQRYDAYLKGTLAPSHNEVVQLGFRLAKVVGLDKFYGIDVDGEFPYDPIVAYAQAHGQTALLDAANADIEVKVKRESALLANGRVTDVLRFLNDPARIEAEHEGFYRMMLKIGGGADQPGAALLKAWYGRNFLICANLVQLAKPGDRLVVFYGSGHAFLLRQCVSEMPGYRLVEPNDYLPK